jgi:sugar phosphate isomerase/epimerase
MQLGIFARTFPSLTLSSNLDAIIANGFHVTQYNLACAGLVTLPDAISPHKREEIRTGCRERNLTIAAISATFNIIDPNIEQRRDNFRRFTILAEAAPPIGTNIVTLCTGTRDPHDMWKHHPENTSAAAWKEMVEALRAIVAIAESAGVMVAIEPETNNVVSSARAARLALDEIGSSRLKIVLDAANLIDSPDPARMRDVLDEAIELLAAETTIAHAKDLTWHDGPQHCAAGAGILDYEHYLNGLSRSGFTGPLILHGLAEHEVAASREFLQDQLSQLHAAQRSAVSIA